MGAIRPSDATPKTQTGGPGHAGRRLFLLRTAGARRPDGCGCRRRSARHVCWPTILAQGGSAVDAMIAAQAVLAVVAPNACGLGGDMLCLVRDTRGTTMAITGPGAAPADLTSVSDDGGASVTTPGMVHGLGCSAQPFRTDAVRSRARAGHPACALWFPHAVLSCCRNQAAAFAAGKERRRTLGIVVGRRRRPSSYRTISR